MAALPEGFVEETEVIPEGFEPEALPAPAAPPPPIPLNALQKLQAAGPFEQGPYGEGPMARAATGAGAEGLIAARTPLGLAQEIASIPAVAGGKLVAGLARSVRDVLSPMTFMPETEQAKYRPFGATREYEPIQSGVPLLPVRGTALQPEGSDAARILSSLTTPESIVMLGAGGASKLAGAVFLGSMAPGILQDVERVASSEASPEEKRDRINSLVLPVILAVRGAKPRVSPGAPDYTQELRPLELTGAEMPGLPRGATPVIPTAGPEVLGPQPPRRLRTPGAVVPETAPEAERDLPLIREIREKNARTKEEIQRLFPQLRRQEAGRLRIAAWGTAGEVGVEVTPTIPRPTPMPALTPRAPAPPPPEPTAFEIEQSQRAADEELARQKQRSALEQGIITQERELQRALAAGDTIAQRDATRKLLDLRRQYEGIPPVKLITPKPPVPRAPGAPFRPEVPGTPAEPYEDVASVVRRKNIHTREALLNEFPAMRQIPGARERAGALLRQIWGSEAPGTVPAQPPTLPEVAQPEPETLNPSQLENLGWDKRWIVMAAVAGNRPINAELFESVFNEKPYRPDMKHPSGYVKEGDRYIFKGPKPPEEPPPAAPPAAPVAPPPPAPLAAPAAAAEPPPPAPAAPAPEVPPPAPEPPPAAPAKPATIEETVIAGQTLATWEAVKTAGELPRGEPRAELARWLAVPNQPSRILQALGNKKRTREIHAPPAPIETVKPVEPTPPAPEPEVTPPTAPVTPPVVTEAGPEQQIAGLYRAWEEGTDPNLTERDLLNHVLRLIDEDEFSVPTPLVAAARDFQAAIEEDFKMAGRGDTERAEEHFMRQMEYQSGLAATAGSRLVDKYDFQKDKSLEAKLWGAAHHVQDAERRWGKLRAKGATDDELGRQLGNEFGTQAGSSSYGGFAVKGGNNPRLWEGMTWQGKPALSGKKLIAKAREVLEIPYPKGPEAPPEVPAAPPAPAPPAAEPPGFQPEPTAPAPEAAAPAPPAEPQAAAAKPPLPKLVADVLARSDKDADWVWFRASPAEREAVDQWILNSKHPLGLQPGTAEGRFKALVKEQMPGTVPVVEAAAEKAQAEVSEVARTQGQRPAKEVKQDLIDALQQALMKAPREAKAGAKVTIEIPDDGTFTLVNAVEPISEVLDRARKIKTDPGKVPGVPKKAVKASGKAISKTATIPTEEPPPETPPSIGPGAAAAAEFDAPPDPEVIGPTAGNPLYNRIERYFQNLFGGLGQLGSRRLQKRDINQYADAADNLPRMVGQQAGNSVRIRLKDVAEQRAVTALMQSLKMSGQGLSQEDAARLGELEFAGNPLGYLRAKKTDMETLAQQYLNEGKKLEAQAAIDLGNAMGLAASRFNQLRPIAELVKKRLDRQIQREAIAGIDVNYERWYVPQRHELDLMTSGNKPIVLGHSRGTGTSTGFKKAKVFEDYATAIENGFVPRSLSIADLLEHRVGQGERLIARKGFFNSLMRVNDSVDGKPLVTKIPRRVIMKEDGSIDVQETVPLGYEPMEVIPGVRVAVHSGYTRLIRALTASSQISESAVVGTLQDVAALEKHLGLALDTFHLSRTLQAELALTGRISVGQRQRLGRALVEYSLKDLDAAVGAGEITQEMADYIRTPLDVEVGGRTIKLSPKAILNLGVNSGLNVARFADVIYRDWLRQIPITGRVNKWVFDKMTRSAISHGFISEFLRVSKAHPEWDAKRVGLNVARDINVMFGNLQKESIFRNPSLRAINQIIFLAPQWVESLARREGRAVIQFGQAIAGAARGEGLRLGTVGRGMGTGLAAYMVGTQILNLITRGHLTFSNEEEGHKLDAWIPDWTGKTKGFFMSPLAVFGEIAHDIIRYADTKPDLATAMQQIGMNKLGNLGRFMYVATVGRDPLSGEKLIGTGRRALAAGYQAIPWPITLSAGTKTAAAAAGLAAPPPPGAVQRQLTASLGFKTEPVASAQNQIFAIADRWKQSQGPKLAAQVEQRLQQDFGPSRYRDLRMALQRQDLAGAKVAYQELRQSGTTPAVIQRTIEHPHPFAGSAALEYRFRRSLTPQQQELYKKALDERKQLVRRFHEMLRTKE